MDAAGNVTRTDYRAHRGKVRETLAGILRELEGLRLAGCARTSCTPPILRAGSVIDSQVALITASRRFSPGVRTILYAGGEKFGLVRFDQDGQYRGTRTSSSCAAGTGSFLDQQARRLGFSGVQELVQRALASVSPPPKISTRCAVFARTDLVHAQQAGYSLEEICDGLCKGLAQNIADTLLGGEGVQPPAVFAGGVSRNAAVRGHLEQILGVTLQAGELSPVFGAIGAALCLRDRCREPRQEQLAACEDLLAPPQVKKEYFYPPLQAEADNQGGNAEQRYAFDGGRFSRLHPVEVDVYRKAAGQADLPVRLGIDVGSTSTKAILIDQAAEPVAGFYTLTRGSPITAVQALCEAVEDLAARWKTGFRFLGAAATGAGRKLIGSIVRADLVVDEITAHARAAYSLDPEIDTIIEIGGQDAKFTTMRGGMVTFSHMNTVCAAGTGSFLEEQAARLGCGLADYEQKVEGARAPLSSDRCAVFMERDINNFLSQGFSTEEILAAALYSVRDN